MSYKDWTGIVYPNPLPRGFSPVEFLSKLFDTIEINLVLWATEGAVTRRWPEQVKANPRFRFTAKLWRGFTHERSATTEDEKLVKDGMAPLVDADRLGAILMQFPISFQNTPDNRQYVAQLQRKFRKYPLVIEVRHRSWAEESGCT
jgi:uncharacterized protein YecE (DUF72 family)